MGKCRSCTRRLGGCRRASFLALLAAFAGFGPILRAQLVEINPTISSAAAPLPADDTPTGNGLITGQFGPNQGPFQYAVHLALRGAYDDNIALTHMHRLGDDYLQVQPSVMFGIGDLTRLENFVAVNYLPSFYRYDDHPEFDSDQHIARLLAGLKSGNLTLRLSQEVAILNNIVLAASSGEFQSLTPTGRTDLDIYNTDVNLNYNFTPADFIFVEGVMNRKEYAHPLVSSELYATDVYLNHAFSRQFVLGVGVEGGYNAVDFPTPDQTMVQTNLHLNYTPGREFSLDVIAGEEFRNFENMTRGTYSTPVFSVSANYMPNDATKITLGGSRQIFNSAALTAQDYVDTSINGMIRERVWKWLYLTILGGYEHVDYFNTISLAGLPTLTDDYYFVQPSADILLTRYLSIGVYYLRRDNRGSVSTVDFYANEYGGRISLKF